MPGSEKSASGPDGSGHSSRTAPITQSAGTLMSTIFCTWNVRTMNAGSKVELQQMDDLRKTAVIDRELHRMNVGIAALQETRLPGNGSLREANYTFFWKGREPEEPRQHGVGFAINNSLLSSIEPPSGGSERLLSLRLNTSVGRVTILCAYAPTLTATDEIKDQFYNELDDYIRRVPHDENILLLGDFNARVGADYKTWPLCIGKHGIGKMNSNGQRLLEMCSHHDLCITNTYFQCKPQHKVSWRHPRSKHWHQLDMIITKRSALKTVLNSRSYHSADCDTDHALVRCKIRFEPRKFHSAKRPGNARINIANTADSALQQDFTKRFQQLLTTTYSAQQNATDRWNSLRDGIHSVAIATFGKQARKNEDWFNANIATLQPLIDAKRKALLDYKANPNTKSHQVLKACRSATQHAARRCANDFWINLCADIQMASVRGDVRSMYDGIKKAIGPVAKKTAPLKSLSGETITDSSHQMKRWIEHFSELYSRQTTISDTASNVLKDLPMMPELDNVPTLDELNKAIDALNCNKAPGNDSIPPEVIKRCKSVLLKPLHDLLCLCWEEGEVPQDMRDSTIITLYKNKGDRSDCNNYRGISLLSIVGKVFARVLLSRLQVLASRVYPESQCGFRANRSTTDMIFAVRQLQEKCREQQQPLYMAFVDLTKAFDLVSRQGLFKLLEKIGCPPSLRSMIISFHTNTRSRVSCDGTLSDPFLILSGVKQGCVLAPTLFGIFFSLMLKLAYHQCSEGVYLHCRHDGNLFNLPRLLKSKTKVSKVLLRELLFADDAALVAHSEAELQSLIDKFNNACNAFGLAISIKKTEIMAMNIGSAPTIKIGNHTLNVVSNFTYLGSTMSANVSLDTELDRRIGKAVATMSRLSKRVWKNQLLTLNTKLRVYEACVLSTLLYGSETWTTYKRQERRLHTFHMRCLMRILNITWQDKVPYSEILALSKVPSMFAMLNQRRLRWLGHVHRMDSSRIPRSLLYGQLSNGNRRRGRPILRFRDACKRDMISCRIAHKDWQMKASSRIEWRRLVKEGIKVADWEMCRKAEEKRTQRKSSTPCTAGHVCTKCGRVCRSRIGLHSHFTNCYSTQKA